MSYYHSSNSQSAI
ncbi:hypothetical protein ID866_9100 [Astraeus odoratus]|nr:hypothetical protein ID866_9100 [Astraeus odoratus]